MKCFTTLFVAIVAVGLFGGALAQAPAPNATAPASPPASPPAAPPAAPGSPPAPPTVKPAPPAALNSDLVNYLIRLIASVRKLLQQVVSGFASAINFVLAIVLKGLLATFKLLKGVAATVQVAQLESGITAGGSPTVANIAKVLIKLLKAEVAGSILLYVLPNAVAKHVVNIKALLAKLQGQPSVPVGTLIDGLGDLLVEEFGLKF